MHCWIFSKAFSFLNYNKMIDILFWILIITQSLFVEGLVLASRTIQQCLNHSTIRWEGRVRSLGICLERKTITQVLTSLSFTCLDNIRSIGLLFHSVPLCPKVLSNHETMRSSKSFLFCHWCFMYFVTVMETLCNTLKVIFITVQFKLISKINFRQRVEILKSWTSYSLNKSPHFN